MRFAIPYMLAAFSAQNALGPSELDELFARWAATQKSAQSLIVEFECRIKDPILKKTEVVNGTVRWIRTANGEILADYELVQVNPANEIPSRFSGLLNGGYVYWLDHAQKKATRYEFGRAYLLTFLERYFNPIVILLDRERTRDNCRLEIIKEDDWYTYLAVTPKPAKKDREALGSTYEIRMALARTGDKNVPKGMPRSIQVFDAVIHLQYDIKSWRLNPADAPKAEEFLRPEDRVGWEVVPSWYYQDKMKRNPS